MFRRKTKLPSAAGGGEATGTRLPDLFAAQVGIFGNAPSLSVVDAGAHHGHTAVQYLEHFPNSRVIALEPEPGNFAIAKETLAPFGERVELLPFAAGNFLYVAGSDLIPELHKETAVSRSAVQLLGLLTGIAFMAALTLLE